MSCKLFIFILRFTSVLNVIKPISYPRIGLIHRFEPFLLRVLLAQSVISSVHDLDHEKTEFRVKTPLVKTALVET